MSGEPQITLRGNLGRTPEKSDKADVVNFTVAVTPRVKKNDAWVDGEPQWYECAAWGPLGDNMVGVFSKGDPVLLVGAVIGARHWESNGKSGDTIRLRAEQVGMWTPTWKMEAREPRDEEAWAPSAPADDNVPF